MFSKISMTGVGNIVKIASALSLVATELGVNYTNETIFVFAIAVYVFGEALSQIGTFLREDLNYGIVRKKPLK